MTSSYTSNRADGPTMHVPAANVGTTMRGRPSMSPRNDARVAWPGAVSVSPSWGNTTRATSTRDPSAAHTSREHQIRSGIMKLFT